MKAASPSAKVVPEATVTTPVDVLTDETTEPEVLSKAEAEVSLCPTASPTLKCLAIAAGTVIAGLIVLLISLGIFNGLY